MRVIQVWNLSKRYRLGLREKQSETLVGQISQIIRSPFDNLKRLRDLNRFQSEDESVFWALKEVSFEVKEGEVLGIIGKNGAGKSTLLKILSQITDPTSGKIEIYGRVASLLEVGTGFHPELSGRENIYMNGTILGMTRREIDSKLDEIIDFSGVEKFIDTPVKFYSSGMKVRLGFSVASHLDPEILIIDEVLAVGDYEFQKKCLGKMEDVSKNQGRTVLFVSHNMAAVQNLCSRTLFLEQGKVIANGETNEIVSTYLNRNVNSYLKSQWIAPNFDPEKVFHFLSAAVVLKGKQPCLTLNINVRFRSFLKHKDAFLAIDVSSWDGVNIFQSIPEPKPSIKFSRDETSVKIQLTLPPLVPGIYNVSIWAGTDYSDTLDWQKNILSFEILESPIKDRTTPHSPIHNGYFCPPSTVFKNLNEVS
ncbi:ABC transporter ATP-binding protein [Algoriphagus sediminis]|uniref:ABC transporter ATP-binding protein n=1 Tax=Algoriphagus sediminis TaxID=3057113 RepID=A0ABT7YE06_9BACT|nr:ABC transporter ATP-binding protein [Algoriphagus sediminis]MDN3204701.1 ABC transporter ATP-binding protein [Algoriphagus sediminis]